MKYKALLVMLALNACCTEPAYAGCHKYSRWYYPFPQRCTSKSEFEAFKPKLAVRFVEEPKIDINAPLAGTFGALRFKNYEDFPKIEVPTDVACPYQDERRKGLCMIKIETEKKNGDKPNK